MHYFYTMHKTVQFGKNDYKVHIHMMILLKRLFLMYHGDVW